MKLKIKTILISFLFFFQSRNYEQLKLKLLLHVNIMAKKFINIHGQMLVFIVIQVNHLI
jgi:hypothetical protein